MPELIAKSALSDKRAKSHGTVTLTEADLGPITAIAMFPGKEKALSKSLKAVGLSMPAPGGITVAQDSQLVWTGRDQAFLIGAPAPAIEGAAVTDQSDGWSGLSLSGPQAADVLMRLIPMDLRASAFATGTAARVALNHMSAILMRPAEDSFHILVFRSMARTAWHEVEDAMIVVAARHAR